MGLEAALVDYIGGLVIPTLTICAFHLGFSLASAKIRISNLSARSN